MNTMKMNYSWFLVGTLLVSATSVHASESPNRLLKELTRPAVVASAKGVSAAKLDGGHGGQAEQTEAMAELFTLEELKNGADNRDELVLPDEDLPQSDIPLALNSQVQYFVSLFQTKGKVSFSRWLSRSSRYIPMMKEILKSKGMPEDLVYVAMIESGFHMHAKSWASAVGPWQFMPATGRRYSLRIDQWVDERKDPVKATTAAALYLKDLYELFNGDWYLAAAGYNAGENKILRAINMYNSKDFWEISKGSYLKRETKEYVPKLLAAAIIAKEPARYGFSDVAYLPAIEFDVVKIPTRTDLELVAKLSGTTYEAIRELNPDLRHWCTPPNYPDYELKLPKGTKQRFVAEYAKVPVDQRFTEKILYTTYKARKRDTIKSVAVRFGISADALRELNGLGKKDRIAGRALVVPAKQTVNFVREGRRVEPVAKESQPQIRYHVVKKGDTLQSLSKKFKVPVKVLAAWNNLKGKVALRKGSRLIVAKDSAKPAKSGRSAGRG